MMNTPNRTIMDSTIKEGFNGNHTRLQGEKQPFEKSRTQEESRTKATRRILENIPSRIDPSKVKIDHFLSVIIFSRFSRSDYLNFCANDWSLACKDQSLWDRLHYILQGAIFVKFFKRAITIFGPKHILFDFSNGDKQLDQINLNHWSVL